MHWILHRLSIEGLFIGYITVQATPTLAAWLRWTRWR
jgi:aryl carrier-like protein